jgi:hypothetical protein
MQFKPKSWYLEEDDSIVIDLCWQEDGSVKYAVRKNRMCMSINNVWMYEPMPSDRDENFFREFRFETFEKACEAVEKYIREKNHANT